MGRQALGAVTNLRNKKKPQRKKKPRSASRPGFFAVCPEGGGHRGVSSHPRPMGSLGLVNAGLKRATKNPAEKAPGRVS